MLDVGKMNWTILNCNEQWKEAYAQCPWQVGVWRYLLVAAERSVVFCFLCMRNALLDSLPRPSKPQLVFQVLPLVLGLLLAVIAQLAADNRSLQHCHAK